MLEKTRKSFTGNILPAAFTELLLISVARYVFGPLLPEISNDLNIGLDVLGAAISLNIFIMLITTLFAGNFIELFGIRRILIAGLLLSVISLFGFFFLRNLSTLLLFCSFQGIGGGLVMVSLIALVNSSYRGNRTIGFFNIFLGTGVGLIIAPLLVSFVTSFNINWRYLFIFIAVVQAAAAFFFLFMDLPAKIANSQGIREIIAANKKIFRSRLVLFYFVFTMFMSAVFEVFYTWFTSYFTVLDISVNISSIILSTFSLGIVIGVIIRRSQIKRISEERMLLYNVIFALVFTLLIIFVQSILFKGILTFLIGFSLAASFILILSASTKALPEQGNIIASYLLVFESIGIIIFQTLSGILSEHVSRDSVPYVVAGMLVVLLFLGAFINYRKRVVR